MCKYINKYIYIYMYMSAYGEREREREMESSEYDSIMDRYWVGVGAGLLVSISALGSSPVARA